MKSHAAETQKIAAARVEGIHTNAMLAERIHEMENISILK
jgi:hypothetical protein